MTLNYRNRLMKTVSIISFSQLIVFAALFIYRYATEKTIPFEYTALTFDTSSVKLFIETLIQPYSFAALAATAILAVYTPVTCMVISYVFEKTQSPEILYFLGFLVGCMIETFRLCIPLFDLWNGYSEFLIYIGKLVFAGRILTVLSLLFSAVFSSDDKIQEADRNLIIAVVVSVVFATAVGIDTRTILPSMMVNTSFQSFFTFARIFIAAMTVIAFLFNKKTKTMLSYAVLFSGYICLTISENIITTTLGFILLWIGTETYFRGLHNYYLWK
ncbi:MAG: hypothetical protein K5751_03375 [Treponemataceae bacterium]|nr:hypothetical protein [Treponemataceae bacterium]